MKGFLVPPTPFIAPPSNPSIHSPGLLDALAAAQLNPIGRWTTSTSGDVQRHTVGKEAAFRASCNFHLAKGGPKNQLLYVGAHNSTDRGVSYPQL